MVITQTSRAKSLPIRRVLAAACLAAGFALAGCEQAMSTSQQAEKTAQESARRAASAGQPRATDELVRQVAAAGDDGKVDVGSHPAQFIVQNTVQKDLTEALASLRQATGAEVGDADKAAFNFGLGTTQLQLSESQLADLQNSLAQVAAQCATLEDLAQSSIDLSNQADALEGWSKKNVPSRGQTTQAAEAATAAHKAADDKQKEVADLQGQITSKQAQARQVYSTTDAAFQTAGEQKGKDAVTAGNKAMADRQQADKLMQEVGDLSPRLAQAQGELDLLNVQAKNAEDLRNAADAGYDLAVQNDKVVAARITVLREAARKIVTDDQGVAARLKVLRDLTADLDTRIKAASDAAGQAAQVYGVALASYSSYMRALGEKVADLDAKDPLKMINTDTRNQALINWAKAAALQQAGRVNLTGYQASAAIDRAVKQAGIASEKLGLKAEGPVAINGAALKSAADAAFDQSVQAAQAGSKMPGKDTDTLKWLGYSLEALAQHGRFITSGDKQYLTLALAARKEVDSRSPVAASQLSWLGE